MEENKEEEKRKAWQWKKAEDEKGDEKGNEKGEEKKVFTFTKKVKFPPLPNGLSSNRPH